MKKYQEYKDFKFADLEKDILKFWEDNDIFAKSISSREGKPQFIFYEGPPSANGKPGIHHVMARAIKDIFCRFRTQQGFQVNRKAGWDTHGLPIELAVEKELGITKDDIGKTVSIEEYNQKCRETVMKYTDLWEKLTQQMGYWVDMSDPYITYENYYIESVWYLLKEIYKKGLLYKGYTVQPYSPKAGSGLSSAELNMPGTYQNVKDTSVTAQFKVKKSEQSAFLFDNDSEEVFILAWTTTPWTLPSNCALAVGKNITYVKVKTFNPYTFEPVSLVLAKDLVGKYFPEKNRNLKIEDYEKGSKKIPFEILAEYKGADLLEVRYEQLLPYVTNENLEKNAFRVIPGDFVTTEDGTGIVHTASVFGADDFRVAQQNGVPAVMVKDEQGNDVPLVDKQGRFVKEVTDFAGRYVKAEYEDEATITDPSYKSTDVLIAIKLKEENRAFKVEKYEHSYPHCWRTDKPILYYPLDSWFIRTTAVKDKLVELNKQINWKPKSTGEGRFGNWLENLVDWNLSRQRYWGIPLPIWRDKDGKEELCIGSIEELKNIVGYSNEMLQLENIRKDLTNEEAERIYQSEKLVNSSDFDLHRPYVDKIVLLSQSGKLLYREADLIDVWFDSGSMPYAQWHYPFNLTPNPSPNGEGKSSPPKEGLGEVFPADFISEGVDQTRGWFFTLHAIAGMLFDSIAFKNVVSTGLVLDKNGQKMSKRLGNAVDPFETLGKYGADATRWYMISNANPWDNLKFDIEGIEEVRRKFFGTLKNTYAFFALYANLDGFQYEKADIPLSARTESDRWIISKLNSLVQIVKEAYEDYEPTKAARAIQDFTLYDLSNWYVRLNRKRFWKSEYNQDKMAAYQSLYTCLETIAKLSAPIMPFYAERLFQDLNAVSGRDKNESIHLSHFPEADEHAIDAALEAKMDSAQTISSLTHALRKTAKVRVRQPLQKVLIPTSDAQQQSQIKAVEDLILTEVNVKEIEFLGDDSQIVSKSIKPNFKVLGKKYKAQMKDVQGIIRTFDKTDIATLEKAGEIQKGTFTFTLEDVVISSEDIEGLSVATDKGLTVALDTVITEDLQKEGIARDVVNRVQNLRKQKNMEVQDKIYIKVLDKEVFVKDALTKYQDYIKTETQALLLDFTESLAEDESFEVDGFEIGVEVGLASN